mmetsp:Transcript_10156/g.21994  ORF Transcript_10156/g.21994 Transcript_10156/m.21994 type:complete len:338 (+) Transcript_10156:92-1105(+)
MPTAKFGERKKGPSKLMRGHNYVGRMWLNLFLEDTSTSEKNIFLSYLESTSNHEAIIRPVSTSTNTVSINTSIQGEFHWRRVHNTHNISTSGGLNNSKERTVQTILCVKLNNLLVVVGALQQLDSGIQRTSISLEDDGNRVNGRVEWVCSEGSSLDGLRSLGHRGNIGGEAIITVGPHNGIEGELELTNVTNGNGVGATGSSNHGVEGTEGTILNVNTHFVGRVIGSLPKLNISVKRTSLGLQKHLNTLNGGVGERPGTEGSSLHNNGGRVVPDLSEVTASHAASKGSTNANINVVTNRRSVVGHGKLGRGPVRLGGDEGVDTGQGGERDSSSELHG